MHRFKQIRHHRRWHEQQNEATDHNQPPDDRHDAWKHAATHYTTNKPVLLDACELVIIRT